MLDTEKKKKKEKEKTVCELGKIWKTEILWAMFWEKEWLQLSLP